MRDCEIPISRIGDVASLFKEANLEPTDIAGHRGGHRGGARGGWGGERGGGGGGERYGRSGPSGPSGPSDTLHSTSAFGAFGGGGHGGSHVGGSGHQASGSGSLSLNVDPLHSLAPGLTGLMGLAGDNTINEDRGMMRFEFVVALVLVALRLGASKGGLVGRKGGIGGIARKTQLESGAFLDRAMTGDGSRSPSKLAEYTGALFSLFIDAHAPPEARHDSDGYRESILYHHRVNDLLQARVLIRLHSSSFVFIRLHLS